MHTDDRMSDYAADGNAMTEAEPETDAEQSGPDGSQYESDTDNVLEEYEEYSSDSSEEAAVRSMRTYEEPAIWALRTSEHVPEDGDEAPIERSHRLANLYAMRASDGESIVGTPTDKAFRSAVRWIIKRPEYLGSNTRCIEAYMNINGVRAFCLFDTTMGPEGDANHQSSRWQAWDHLQSRWFEN
jgi:hypothetical protein